MGHALCLLQYLTYAKVDSTLIGKTVVTIIFDGKP
jgi:hypothetical protein